MKEHREQYGITGNCFDLSIWLLDEFQSEGITAYPISHNLHSAVIALDENGNRYLCDLGDQWIRPILVSNNHEEYTDEKLSDFFPGAKIQVKHHNEHFEILYHRPNGKISRQVYNPSTIDNDTFFQAAEYSQNQISQPPLLECRVFYENEIAHWEFNNWESFLSSNEGLIREPKLSSIEQWVDKINEMTQYDKEFLLSTLEMYKEISKA
ncbi:hypothetical protein [Sporosarcina sp. ACRSL]|uniref:hypothetical protein n=1 Tax=Sporosarcina sp. ACRSL TaxID=2918215 RepID=UPI00351D41F8